MIAWMVAGLAVLAALACVVWALRLRRERTHWKHRCDDTERTIWQVQDQYEAQQGDVALAAVAADVGVRLQAPTQTLRQQRHQIDGSLQRYRGLVEAYDQAVQYCLQPVELLPGADGDTMERLIRHISEARRGLFAARTHLLDAVADHTLSAVRDDGNDALAQIDAIAGALRRFADNNGAETSVHVNDWLASALLLTQSRLPAGIHVIKRLEALPPLAAAPWLGSVLLRLLRSAASAAGEHGNLIVRTRCLQRHIEVHIMGHATVASADTLEQSVPDTDKSLQALQNQLQYYGASLQMMPAEGRGHGFVLCLPERAEALAA